jgi:AAA domain/UvrD-like helicase C-terminal domain
MEEGQNQVSPVLSRSQAIAFSDQNPHLNRAQRGVVEDVLSSPDRVQGIQGYAGTGKTTTLSVGRAALETQGYAVEGFAPTSGVSVYREVAHEFSVGERIRLTAPDKSLGVANRDIAGIDSFGGDGSISARLDNGRQIEFDPTNHRHFDHGYAVTSYSAQGLTAERVLINADTGVHPDLLNSQFGYVAVSRASHEASIFTDDTNRLNQRIGTEVSKSSALTPEQIAPSGRDQSALISI